jgi:hypothetical protein
MKVNGFACDQCEKFCESNADFYIVNRGDFIVEVCCSTCLRRMAAQLVAAETKVSPTPTKHPERGRPAIPSDKAIDAARVRLNVKGNGVGGNGGATPNDEPCDVCGRMIPTRQGLAAHRRKAHGKAGLPGTKVTSDGRLLGDTSLNGRSSRATLPGVDFNGATTGQPSHVESDA